MSPLLASARFGTGILAEAINKVAPAKDFPGADLLGNILSWGSGRQSLTPSRTYKTAFKSHFSTTFELHLQNGPPPRQTNPPEVTATHRTFPLRTTLMFSKIFSNVWGQTVAESGLFVVHDRIDVSWNRRISIDDWLIDQSSHSYVASLAPPIRNELLSSLRELLATQFPHGDTAVRYKTWLWTATKR